MPLRLGCKQWVDDMSNLWFNIRFGTRHLQLSRDWELSFKVNPHWIEHTPDKWLAVYCAFGHHFD
jgi:hypothetical protein